MILNTLAVLQVVQHKISKQFVRMLLRVQRCQLDTVIKIGYFEKLSPAYSHKRFASSSEGGNWTLYQPNSATFMQNSHRISTKVESVYVPAKSWRSFSLYTIPYIVLYLKYTNFNNKPVFYIKITSCVIKVLNKTF